MEEKTITFLRILCLATLILYGFTNCNRYQLVELKGKTCLKPVGQSETCQNELIRSIKRTNERGFHAAEINGGLEAGVIDLQLKLIPTDPQTCGRPLLEHESCLSLLFFRGNREPKWVKAEGRVIAEHFTADDLRIRRLNYINVNLPDNPWIMNGFAQLVSVPGQSSREAHREVTITNDKGHLVGKITSSWQRTLCPAQIYDDRIGSFFTPCNE